MPIGKSAALKRAMARYCKGQAIALTVSELERKKGYSWWSAFGGGVGDGRTTVYLASGELFADHGAEVRIFASGKTLGDSDLVSPVWRPCRGRTDAIPPKPSLIAIS